MSAGRYDIRGDLLCAEVYENDMGTWTWRVQSRERIGDDWRPRYRGATDTATGSLAESVHCMDRLARSSYPWEKATP